ncbi:MAG: hypothetical protein WCA46_22520, partial [Actinocatenispora sp.]
MRAPSAETDGIAPVAERLPALVEGIELVGEFEDSGYRVPPQLVYRPDGQVVHLPSLLYLLVKILDGRRHLTSRNQHPTTRNQHPTTRNQQPTTKNQNPARKQNSAAGEQDGLAVLSQVATMLSRETGRDFTAEHVTFLLDKKLAPLGITTYSDGTEPLVEKATPFLSLRFRVAVIPASVTWFLGGAFGWLFKPLVMLLVISAGLFGEIWLFMTQHMGAAVAQSLVSPVSILLIIAFAIMSSAFHEVGHAAACRYSGARPGVMGCGLYLVWPAFYTDITDSYRLDRVGRIRTDLGGVYFNAIFVVALSALYAWTGAPILLVAILSTNLEMLQQLLPTLRFDGYYIVSDLVGIPDLFKYIGPILKRAVLRRPADKRLEALKRWPQILVTVWVLAVIPALVIQLAIVLVRLPGLIRNGWQTILTLVANASAQHSAPAVVAAALQILLLMLPVVGVLILVVQMLRGLVKLARHRVGFLRAAADRLQSHIPSKLLNGALTLLLVLLLVGVGWALTASSSPQHPPVVAQRTAPGSPTGGSADRHSPSDGSRPAPSVPRHPGSASDRTGAAVPDVPPGAAGPGGPAGPGTAGAAGPAAGGSR